MKIVHLTDIHFSNINYLEFQRDFKDALIKDLRQYLPIDIIVITGDLVDRGGDSLYKIPNFKGTEDRFSPYDIFKQVFIDPICKGLNLPQKHILFIPGNHDVDEQSIGLVEESILVKDLNDENIASKLQENMIDLRHSSRIRRFKDFEKKYHLNTENYNFSNNQSTFIYKDKDGLKIGFLLINDSWRCKSVKLLEEFDKKEHYVGVQQFYDGLDYLESNNTQINICLLHHDLKNFKDEDPIKGVLVRKNIEIVLFGHYHMHEFINPLHINGSYLSIRGRASLNKPDEKDSRYKPGYQVIEVVNSVVTAVHYRVYNNDNMSKFFHSDSSIAPTDGIDRNMHNNNLGYKLSRKDSSYSNLNIEDFK